MTDYNKGSKTPVEHKSSKYDGFTLIKTEHPYRHQKGSGRAATFTVAKNGMTVGEWTKICATKGVEGVYYHSKFCTGSLIKLQGAKEPGWKISEKNDKNQTLEEVKKVREIDPAKAAEREAKAKAAAEAKAAKKTSADAKKKATAEASAAKKTSADAKKKAESDAKAAKAAKSAKNPA